MGPPAAASKVSVDPTSRNTKKTYHCTHCTPVARSMLRSSFSSQSAMTKENQKWPRPRGQLGAQSTREPVRGRVRGDEGRLLILCSYFGNWLGTVAKKKRSGPSDVLLWWFIPCKEDGVLTSPAAGQGSSWSLRKTGRKSGFCPKDQESILD